MKLQIVLIPLLAAVSQAVQNMHLHLFNEAHANKTGARCMDGTSRGYYFSQGTTDKVLMYLEGGGQCYGYGMDDTGVDCDYFIGTDSGSSANWAKTMDYDGFFDSQFFDGWHKLYLPYCTGDWWGGMRTEPDEHGSYFAGGLAVKATIDHYLKNNSITDPSEVILSGCSAGGIGTIHNVDVLADHLPNSWVRAISFSGYFPSSQYMYDESYDYVDLWNQGAQLWSDNGKTPLTNTYAKCVKNEEDPTLCIGQDKTTKYVKTPFFLVQEQFDSDSIWYEMGTPDYWDDDGLDYAEYYLNSTNTNIKSMKKHNGFFLTSCVGHCKSEQDMSNIWIGSLNLETAFNAWYQAAGYINVRVIEECDAVWPPCNNGRDDGNCCWDDDCTQDPDFWDINNKYSFLQ